MNDSILLIQSQDSKNSSMGTGFVIHQDEFGSYILTCAHVIEQVGKAKILEYEVVVKYIGSSDTIDLALLYVQNLHREPLKLQVKKIETIDVHLIGYSFFNKIKYQKKSREATILTQVNLEGREDNQLYKSWQIIAKDHNEIESGNSGGPLICNNSGKVIGVVSNNKGLKQGYAIDIEHILDIWIEHIPLLLIENKNNEESPFVGLSAFSIKEAHLFYGRNEAVKDILNKLQENNLVSIVGESGSGKSSLIKAGVIPKYLNGVLKLEDDESFHLLSIRPGENAFTELSDTVERITKSLNLDFETVNGIQKAIKERDNHAILNAFKYLFKNESQTRLLIYIDQFEELFTSRTGKEENENAFIEFLLYLLRYTNESSQFKIKIIFTIRADYYDLISDHKTFSTLVKKSRYDVKKMTKLEIRECIEKPLERTYIDKVEIIPFTNAVIEDMDDNPHELTLLQIALNETWNKRSLYNNNLLQTYHAIGEVSGALSTLAENTWKSLDTFEKKILQYVFIRVIKPSDIGGATKRIAERDEFSDDAWKLARKLTLSLDKSGKSSNRKSAELGRLLKIRMHQESEVVELMHEILVRKWSRYRRWLIVINRNSLHRVHEGVIVKSNAYFNTNKDKKFLLTGYELEESQKLINSEYRKYLSDNEVVFIENSDSEVKADLFRKKLLRSGLYIALGVIALSLWEVEKQKVKIETQKDKVVSFLTQTTKSTVLLLEGKDTATKNKYVNETFSVIIDEFDGNKDKNISLMVLKAKFGKGITFTNMGKYLKAIEAYDLVIEEYGVSRDEETLEFVVKALHNKGRLFHIKIRNAKKANDVYTKLIKNFKNSKSMIILEIVAKAWYSKASLFKSKNVALELIEHFLEQKISFPIKVEVVKAHAYRAWLYLLVKEYKKAQKSAKKGLKILSTDHASGLNLAHSYLLLGDINNARRVYKKYHVKEEELETDFNDFKEVKIQNSYFSDIEFLLNNNKRGVKNAK